MIKIIYNNIILDVCKSEKYIKYLPELNRSISVAKDFANGILGSDSNTIYHLFGTINNFPFPVKTVRIERIDQKEFSELAGKIILQKEEDTKLKEEVENLKQLVTQQNFLIQQLLEKLS